MIDDCIAELLREFTSEFHTCFADITVLHRAMSTSSSKHDVIQESKIPKWKIYRFHEAICRISEKRQRQLFHDTIYLQFRCSPFALASTSLGFSMAFNLQANGFSFLSWSFWKNYCTVRNGDKIHWCFKNEEFNREMIYNYSVKLLFLSAEFFQGSCFFVVDTKYQIISKAGGRNPLLLPVAVANRTFNWITCSVARFLACK